MNETMKNRIYPCLWVNGLAREAASFYCDVFGDSRIISDSQVVVAFELSGQKFICLNAGSEFVLNPAISFFVLFESREELNETWNRLMNGGAELMPLEKYEWSERYGWLQDRYGASWQLALGKMSDVGQKFTPTLLFTGTQHGRADEAVRFYTSVFKNSSITGILKYNPGENEPEGSVKHAQFKLDDHVFMAMDSSMPHQFSFNEALSLVVECNSQEEIDYFWYKLTEDGEESMCGWLKDKFGISWQIVPAILGELMSNPERSARVIQAFMQMKKFEIDQLVNA